MNLADLHQKLIAVARGNPPSDSVPYAFAKRIMARLPARPALDHWAFWARALWCAAAPCVAVTLLLTVWASSSKPAAGNASPDLAQQIDTTMLAAVDQDSDFSW